MVRICDLLWGFSVKSEIYFSFCLQQQKESLIFATGAIPLIVGIGMMSSTG